MRDCNTATVEATILLVPTQSTLPIRCRKVLLSGRCETRNQSSITAMHTPPMARLIQKIHLQAPGPASVKAPAINGPTAEMVAPMPKMRPMYLPLSRRGTRSQMTGSTIILIPPGTNTLNSAACNKHNAGARACDQATNYQAQIAPQLQRRSSDGPTGPIAG